MLKVCSLKSFFMLENIIISLPRPLKKFIFFLLDCILAMVAVWLAYFLRIGEFISVFSITDEHIPYNAYIFSLILFPFIFYVFGLYHEVSRYIGATTLKTICYAFFCYSLLLFLGLLVFSIPGIPRTVGLIQPILFFLLVICVRLFARAWLGSNYSDLINKKITQKVVIYGTGKAGLELLSVLEGMSEFKIIGFISDNRNMLGNYLNGVKIYPSDKIDFLVKHKSLKRVFFAESDLDKKITNQIFTTLLKHNLSVQILPSSSDFVGKKTSSADLREITIDEILGRESVEPDLELMKSELQKNTILVTGAGGSIGSELCRQIIKHKPHKLVLFDHGEYSLFQITNELTEIRQKAGLDFELSSFLGSVKDKKRLTSIFEREKPSIVYHAAAYKHVSIVENNFLEGLANNTFGTQNVVDVCFEQNVLKCVLISTDKAVKPSNIMGKSKRLAEMIFQARSCFQEQTKFSIVRFGNVLGSSGSVVPIFEKQIEDGGPVTVRHKDLTRYFMTIPEAANLVIQAGALTQYYLRDNGSSPIFILDMGEPVKIFDLAESLIRLRGLSPKKNNVGDIDIEITELQPGEKIDEELFMGEGLSSTFHEKIFVSSETFHEPKNFLAELKKLELCIVENNYAEVKQLLSKFSFE